MTAKIECPFPRSERAQLFTASVPLFAQGESAQPLEFLERGRTEFCSDSTVRTRVRTDVNRMIEPLRFWIELRSIHSTVGFGAD